MTGAEIVAEARRWRGVPFAHQGRTRAGTDCGGLIGGVAVALGIVSADWWERTFDPAHGGYSRQPSHGQLSAICESFMRCIEIDDARPGDVALMRFRADPQHLGILADYRHGGLSIVHALSSAREVCEHRLSPLWRDRIVSVYRMPGVA